MHVMKKRIVRWLAPVVLGCSGAAFSQDKPADWPARPVRMIVSVAPGAGADTIARAVAQMLSERIGQNTIVDNRPGGGGVLASELVAKAPPDGYTIMSQGDAVLLQGILRRVRFDVRKTFEPIVATSTQPYVLLVGTSMPVRSIEELVAHSAKDTITYSGSSGIGSTVHLGMEHFARLSGAKLLFVPYKGSAPSIIAVMGGEIHMAAASAIAATGAIRTGKVRALATMGLTRLPSMPDVPTVAEQGFPGFKITNRYTLWAPAGTPKPIIAFINRVVSDGMHAPEMVKRLLADGSQPAERMSPEALEAAILADYAELEQQVQRLDTKLE